MSRLMTRILAPSGEGIQEDGRRTAPEMIALMRAWADHWRKTVEQIDTTPEEDFAVDVVMGVFAQRHVSTVQEPTGPQRGLTPCPRSATT